MPLGQATLPLDPADLATHVLWKLEGRGDVLQAIPQLIANVENVGAEPHGSIQKRSGDQDLAVRSVFALTSLAYNERLRDRICDAPGFLCFVAQRATSTEEPSLASAYMSLLQRLTFRLSGSPCPLPKSEREQLLNCLAAHATTAASSSGRTSSADSVPSLGVLANLTRGCLTIRSYVKAQPGAPELYRALAQLLVGPGTLCIVFALQALANLVLHEPLGAALFAEDNLRRIFEIVLSLVKDADQSEQAHHALRVASDLLNDLFLAPRVLELLGNVGTFTLGELASIFEAIATLRHSFDPALPLLELVCALSRQTSVRAQLSRAVNSERGERARVLGALLSLATSTHVDVALAASEILTALCHQAPAGLGCTLDTHDRSQAINALAGILCISTHQEDNSILEIQDFGRGLKLRRHAACRLLRELAQTAAFREVVRATLHAPSMVKEAKAALQEQDASLVLAMLLLAFECWDDVLVAERREFLLLARSQTVVEMWAQIMACSQNTRALYECLSAACNLLSTSKAEETTVLSGTPSHIATALPAWIEIQTLVEALAANHRCHEHELGNLRQRLLQLEDERAQEKEQALQARATHEAELQQEARVREAERQRHTQELQASATQLADARRRGDEAVSKVAQESVASTQMRARFEAAERQIEDAELTHADLLQRALKAENLCRQLTAKLEEKDLQIKRANEDREGLLGEVERRQRAERAVVEVREASKRLDEDIGQLGQEKLGLQRENAQLADARERMQDELRRACADAEDQRHEAQRRAALVDARAEDLGRRLASSSASTRTAEMARDDALREASWLRCELATFQRLEHDRENSRSTHPPDWHQPATTVEQRLRERAAQAHSEAMETKS